MFTIYIADIDCLLSDLIQAGKCQPHPTSLGMSRQLSLPTIAAKFRYTWMVIIPHHFQQRDKGIEVSIKCCVYTSYQEYIIKERREYQTLGMPIIAVPRLLTCILFKK